MWPSISPFSSIATILLLSSRTTNGSPVGLADGVSNHTLDIRDYPVSCGYNNLYPCMAGQVCYTANGQALCTSTPQTPAAGGASMQWYTTTYVISGLVPVTTITSTFGVAGGQPAPTATPAPGGTCSADQGFSTCGGTNGVPVFCCNLAVSWCNTVLNACSPYGTDSSGLPPATPGGPSSTISNFVAPTSVGVVTLTSTGTATTTVPFQTPIGSSGSSLTGVMAQTGGGGLSAGAIAGIVIGVLAGLLILFLILACLCCRSIFDAIFGRKKRKETTTYIETHHSHHGSAAAPPPRRRWFGVLPARADRPEKKSSGFGGLLGVGAALAALAVILGLRRRRDRREEKTEYTGSEYTYSDYYTETSESSASSGDRRTRDSRRSRSHR